MIAARNPGIVTCMDNPQPDGHSLSRMTSLSLVRRIVVAVMGFTVLFIGLALLMLPGPAFVVIPLGLAILATEFVWARSLLNKVRPNCLGRRGNTRSTNLHLEN